MPDWLEEYRQRAKNCGGLIPSGVPGVPNEEGQEHREHRNAGAVFQQNTNYYDKITPGTPGTPPGDIVRHASHNEALPGPTLEVLACLREHFAGRGFRETDTEALALAALGELMRRKGGPVALAERVGTADELAKAVKLVRAVFGPEVEREGGQE